MFDRIGNQHRVSVGYRGTMSLIFEIGNVLIDRVPHAAPDAWPLPAASLAAAAPLTA
jgi:nitrogenase molybdenum-iron protein NifN